MAGFLDKNTRIVDMVMTGYGKRLLSEGELRFVYWAAFDDEVDYDPCISQSSSLSSTQLSQSRQDQIEATLVREAVTGYRLFNNSGSDNVNVCKPLFTAPQGQVQLPRLSGSSLPTGSLDIVTYQQRLQEVRVQKDSVGNVIETLGPYDRGVQRFNSDSVNLFFEYVPGSWPAEHRPEGFVVRFYVSGAEGYHQVEAKLDSSNDISFNNDLKVYPFNIRGKLSGDEG